MSKNENLTEKSHWSDKLNTKLILVFFIVLAVAYFHKIIFGMGDLWEDLLYQEYPFRVFAKSMLSSFKFPHWVPYTFGGMPFFAALQPGVLYPGNLVLSVLPVNEKGLWYLIQVSIAIHLIIGALSMYIYAQYRERSKLASIYAAISFMFCGFFITHLIHSTMINVIVWLPLIVFFMERGLREAKIHLSVIAGLIFGLSTLAGHPQITFYEFLFLGLFSLYILIDLKNIKLILNASIIFIIAIGIMLIQYLPAMEFTGYSSRTAWTFEQLCEGSISFPQLLTFLMPKVFGAYTGPSSGVPTFWLPGHMNGYYTYWDTTFYMGVGIFILALFQFKNFKKSLFLKFVIIWAIFSVSIALGKNFFVYKLLYMFVPGFDKFRSPARILFTWNFIFPILAAFTIDGFRDKENKFNNKIIVIALSIAGVIGLLTLSGFLKSFWPIALENKNNADYTAKQGLVLLINVLFILTPVILYWKDKISLKNAQIFIVGALIIDMFTFGINHHVNQNTNAPKYFGQNRQMSASIKKESEKEHFRTSIRQFILTENDEVFRQSALKVLKRNQGMVDNIELYEGLNTLQLGYRVPPTKSGKQFQMFLDLLNIKYFVNPGYNGKDRSQQLMIINNNYLPRAKMFYNYKVFSSDSLVADYIKETSFNYHKQLLLSEEVSVESFPDSVYIKNSVQIKKYEANSLDLEVETEKPGLLWMSEIWYPAWKAYVDNKPVKVLRADYSFRAIEIPEGNHKVTFKYESKTFKLGFISFLLTILASLGYLIWYFYFLRHKKD